MPWNDRDDNIIFEKYERSLIWSEDNHYVDVDDTSLLIKLEDINAAKTINYYDGHMHPDDAKVYITECSDKVIVDTCDALSDISCDFADDMLGWAKYLNGNSLDQIGDFREDPKVGREVMSKCGAGYTRLFVMFAKVLEKPDMIFLTNPTTSLHPHLSKAVLGHLKYMSEDTKFVITDSRDFVPIDKMYFDGVLED